MTTFSAARLRRALIIKQRSRAGWAVILRDYQPAHPTARPGIPERSLADAISEARAWFRAHGIPVLIQPLGELERAFTGPERHMFVLADRPPTRRPTLAETMGDPDGGAAE